MSESQPLPDSADTVIVGAGIVGCAVAYHLSERRDDVVVVEQGPIFDTGGSTSHAPAMTIETVSSKSFSRIGQYTVDLFSDLSVDGTPALEQVGNVEFALSEEVMDAMRRKQELGLAWGVSDAQLLSPAEIPEVAPLLDGADSLQGAFYAATDGYTNPVVAAEAMGRRAQDNGARFVPHTTVTDIETADGSVTAVETDRGTVETDTVLAATNLWAPLLEEMVDVELPYLPVVHQYAITEDVPTMEGLDSHPILRNKDIRLYFREEGPTNDAVGIGSYRHDARIVDPHDLSHPDEDDAPAKLPYTPADFDPIYEDVQSELPALDGSEIVDGFDGLLGFSPTASRCSAPHRTSTASGWRSTSTSRTPAASASSWPSG
ncbi:FAD-dependent oxidoreductase [Haloarculaceae archaeon H-GB2-1]|nr:FAD-dependent oxidoreductase [Haloarculaceae archaeon H-GB11]MEA5409502.1 FAD-dependent oxidoreductase [Haloarculaceae archaeon H-GB2-1]